MRLIDADELQELLNWTHDRPPFSREKVKHMIDKARIVDAIPIEYIEKTVETWSKDGYEDDAENLSILVHNWKMELAERKEE